METSRVDGVKAPQRRGRPRSNLALGPDATSCNLAHWLISTQVPGRRVVRAGAAG